MELKVIEEKGFQYVEQGEGEVLLLLHGLFGALSNWQDVFDKFSPNYRVIIPLMPVYEMPLLKTSVSHLAKYVHKFVKFIGIKEFTLLGNSLGGHVALVFVLEHPEMVSALMLTGSSGLYENSMGGSFPKREDYNFIKEKVEYTFYAPETATKELVDEVFEIVNNRNKVIRILAMAKSAMRHNLRKEIPDIKIPVCLIWGQQDTITPPEVALEFDSLLPKSELHWIDKCGHAAMMEQPQAFNLILGNFLEKQKK
ncbi:MAG: pimeloyl-ACP methyl ester carboxylesterase [Sphingobacteriales bacterium]|jgi:pimeloyl-ACP methyl ester carboxylesterase